MYTHPIWCCATARSHTAVSRATAATTDLHGIAFVTLNIHVSACSLARYHLTVSTLFLERIRVKFCFYLRRCVCWCERNCLFRVGLTKVSSETLRQWVWVRARLAVCLSICISIYLFMSFFEQYHYPIWNCYVNTDSNLSLNDSKWKNFSNKNEIRCYLNPILFKLFVNITQIKLIDWSNGNNEF